MAGNWDALGLGGGGMGRVDIRGATPPIGKTGPGGVEGMGLLALLRRLSMGMDEPGQTIPEPMSPDPASASSMQNLGRPEEMMDLGRMMMGLEQPDMPLQGPMMADDLSGGAGQDRMMPPQGQPMMGIAGPSATDLEAMGGQPMPLEPSAFDFEQAFGRPYTPPGSMQGQQPAPEQDSALWQMLRRMGVPG